MAKHPRAAGRECHHCKEWIPRGTPHDCWTTTEDALTRDLSDDLRDAWERLRETAVDFGEQRIYASGSCIMFSRDVCYFFVRPRRSFLEVCFFLGRTVTHPLVKRAEQSSKVKVAHIAQVRHRDQVEEPLTDWLREGYHWIEERNQTVAPPRRATSSKRKPASTAARNRRAR